ncbi:MAG: prephenate dehydrogenase/arogenate dehydrogenase family protein [Burkholderiales bacterium]|jgi:prephenate dehydrogenase|nr:prephenate dehydrogenase/arogenate dehydrogenase family protein [Burkholderiales bacterium]
MTVPLRCLAIVGVGLIGGSAALALKRAAAVERVIGVGRSRANLDRALQLGVIDAIETDAAAAAAQADTVLVATPVGQIADVFAAIAPVLRPGAVVTDGGSTKQDVVAAARAQLGAALSRFVPAHPIAGAEHSGVAAARADLYDGRNVVLTPLDETAVDAVDRVDALWAACRARVSRMTPAAHDATFAAVSHLPHVLAYALVDSIVTRADAQALLRFAASGFRDFTRIASSAPEMWRDICLANRDALLVELDRYADALAMFRAQIAASDGAALEARFAAARDARNAWLETLERR